MMMRFSLRMSAAIPASLGMVLALATAGAQTTTNVSLAPFPTSGTLYGPGNWSGNPYNSTIATAPINGSGTSGITFTDWSGQYQQINPYSSQTFSIGDVALGNDSTVNTLLNTFYGIPGLNAIVSFTNNDNQTVSYDLDGDDTIRDYNQNDYQNTLTGGSVLGGVTAQNWYANGNQRLDVQTFYLPADWGGTELTSITIDNPTGSANNTGDNPDPDIVFSALQVDSNNVTPSATPEPSAIVLLGTGLLGVAGAVKRKLSRR